MRANVISIQLYIRTINERFLHVAIKKPLETRGITSGGCEIRTREGLHPTRFPSVRHRPLGESSKEDLLSVALLFEFVKC